MFNADDDKNPIFRHLTGGQTPTPPTTLQIERDRQLRQSVEIVNQLINENAHRPDAIRLLRKILRERAELKQRQEQDKNSLSG